jgi:hypothetical protein
MPRGQHVAGASPKANRMYEHIKRGYLGAGRSVKWAKKVAAMTVNKYRAAHGQTKRHG